MKLEVFEKKEVKKDEPVRLMLKPYDLTGIELVAVDEHGETVESGHILYFESNGKMYLNSGVSKDLGFKLTDDGHIWIG